MIITEGALATLKEARLQFLLIIYTNYGRCLNTVVISKIRFLCLVLIHQVLQLKQSTLHNFHYLIVTFSHD